LREDLLEVFLREDRDKMHGLASGVINRVRDMILNPILGEWKGNGRGPYIPIPFLEKGRETAEAHTAQFQVHCLVEASLSACTAVPRP